MADGRAADAAAFALARLPDPKLRLPPDSPGAAALLCVLGTAQLALGRPVEAEAALRGYLAFREKMSRDNEVWLTSWKHGGAQSLLGGALLAQGKFAEAEPLIVSGYEGMQKREAGIEFLYRPQYYEALARVVDLYTQWGKSAQAAEWQQKLDTAAVPTRNVTQVRTRPIAESVLQTKAPRNLAFALPAADATANAPTVAPPAPWGKMGNQVASYVMGVDCTQAHRQPTSAYVKSTRLQIVGTGGMMQSFAAADYRGRRVRFSACIKTNNAETGAQLLLRLYRQDGQVIAIDNMDDRPVKGTVGWREAAVVMDVPAETAAIAIGFFLSGTGQMWVNDAQFEIVGVVVPVTVAPAKSAATTGK